MSRSFDAVVIGAGASGLIAAAYLARGGTNVCVLEAADVPGGSCAAPLPLGGGKVCRAAPTLFALDRQAVKELKLARHGLSFTAPQAASVLLRGGGAPLVFARDEAQTARALAMLAASEAEHYRRFRRELAACARALDPAWRDEALAPPRPPRRFALTGAADMLNETFDSAAARAAFAFDALEGGLSPAAAGSALLLAWRAAQERISAPGVVPVGGLGALIAALAAAAGAAGVIVRTKARVAKLIIRDEKLAGVALESGEEIAARTVLSSLSRRTTLLELAPAGAGGLGVCARLAQRAPAVASARLVLLLDALPDFAVMPARFLFAADIESAVAAHAEARAGRLPGEPLIEAVIPDLFDPASRAAGTHVLSLTIRPLPRDPLGGWPRLAQTLILRVLDILERHAPKLKASIRDLNFDAPLDDGDPCDGERLTASWRSRIETPIPGLYLCGTAAEPVPALSGRAARIAAARALAAIAGGRR
jgi:phytoene dehydrogenase-like protein